MTVSWREARRASASRLSLQIVTEELANKHWAALAKEVLKIGKAQMVSDVRCHIWSERQLVTLSCSKAISVLRLKMLAALESLNLSPIIH